jgi:Arc/MetJ-type ribon-helix-helix transcriptional regulator
MVAHTLHTDAEVRPMAAKTVGFAIADEDRSQLDALVEHYGHGNRSEFLRVAMKHLRHDMWAEKMQGIQSDARVDLGGRVVSAEEVTALVKRALSAGE